MRLSEEAAWAIAMTWQEPLQSHVRLTTDEGNPMGLVDSYEWVRFEAPSPLGGRRDDESLLAFAATARYATLTWLALSNIPGYSGAENPVFWRRVFDVLQMEKDPDAPRHRAGCAVGRRSLPAVTDAIRFFPDASKPFPRVRILLPDLPSEAVVVAFCRVFCGALEHHGEEQRAILQGVFTQLRPWFDPKEIHHVVDVDFNLHALCPGTLSTDLNVLLDSCSVINQSHAIASSTGVRAAFVVRHLSFRRHFGFFETLDVLGASQLFRDTRVTVERVGFAFHGAASSRSAFASFVRAVFGGHQQSLAHVQVLFFPMSYISDEKFDALCSALPLARSIHTMQLDRRPCRSHLLPTRDVAWLAYAIFHPDAAESSWKALDLKTLDLSPEYVDVFRTMSRGNNLLAFLDGTPPSSQAYYSARLAEGTVVFFEPRLSDVVLTLNDSSTRFDVCVNSDDVTAMDDWVCVIVPCWGRGWIQKHSIIDVITRQPSSSFLTGLRVEPSDSSQDANAVLADMLAFIGGRLEYIDARCVGEMSSETLRGILEVCTALRSLDVGHDGRLWTDSSAVSTLPHLEELALSLREDQSTFSLPCEEALAGCLKSLAALRISTPYCADLNSSREALLTMLKRLPSLQYLHWVDLHAHFAPRGANPAPYIQVHEKSWRLMEIPALTRNDLNIISLLALLSVVKRKATEGSALGYFNQDLVSRIASDAATRSHDLWIDLYPRNE